MQCPAISKTHLSAGDPNDGALNYTAEASDLGWRAGRWPNVLTYGGDLFVIKRSEVQDGDLLWIDYFNAAYRVTIRIYND